MQFRFDEEATVQAAAYLLKKAGGRMNYMKLIKLLYLADRTALLEYGKPITGDVYVAMDQGPVLSHVLDFINNKPLKRRFALWYHHINPPRDYKVSLKKEAGDGSLCDAEIELLDALWEKYKDRGPWAMVKELHDTCSEWGHPNGGCFPIRPEDILTAGGKSPEEISQLESEIDSHNEVCERLGA